MNERNEKIEKIFEDAGERLAELAPASCRPLLLSGNCAWIVGAGSVNIFSSAVKENLSYGTRSFVTHFEAGSIIFPASFFEYKNEKVCLIADTNPGTVIYRMERDWLDVMNSESGIVSTIMRDAFYNWIDKLSDKLCHENLPLDCEPVMAEKFKDAAAVMDFASGRNFRPAHGILWTFVKNGFCVLCGNEENLLMAEGSVFPLSHRLWMKSLDNSTSVEFRKTDIVKADAELADMFDKFYGTFYRTFLLTEVYRAGVAHSKRSTLASLEQTALNSAIDELAGLNRPGAERVLNISTDSLSDPYLSVIEILMKSAGFKFKFNDKVPEGISGDKMLCSILERASLYYRKIELVPNWWKSDGPGMIAFYGEERKPLALIYNASRAVYTVYDPEKNSMSDLSHELIKKLTHFAYAVYPQLPSKKLKVRDILKFTFSTLRPVFFVILMVGILDSIVSLAQPYITGIIFNTVIPHADIFQLLQITVILVTAAVTSVMFTISRSFAMLRIKTITDYKLQAAVVGRMLRLPLPVFKKYSTGDLAQRVMGVETMREILADNVTSAAFAMFLSLPNLVLMCYYSWKLALCGLAAILISVTVFVLIGLVNCVNQRNQIKISGELSGFILQAITGINKIRNSISENRAFIKWSAKFSEETRWHVRVIKNTNFIMIFNSFYPAVITAVFFYLVGGQWKGLLNMGDYLAFNSAFAAFMAAVVGFAGILPSLVMMIPLYQRLAPVFESEPESDDSLKSPGELDGNVELKNISYRYREDSPLILNDVNISAQPGEFIAIVGPSGAGKSTIIRMLLAFENPETGGVYYSGQDISVINRRELRKQIGSVLQSDGLIAGSIYQNIAGTSNMTIDEAMEAASMAGCAKDIDEMPMGIHTLVSNATVSGGQRQRILIARALAKRPRVIIFDEATSALDNETQLIVSESLERLNATRIVVAHRLSTIQHADRIYVMEKGRVVQTGSFSELIKQPGLFSSLAGRQMV